MKKGFTPLHSAVWSDDKKMEFNIDSIINTLDILLNKYKIRIFTVACIESAEMTENNYKHESVLGAIYEQNSIIPMDIKNRIYDYLTLQANSELFITEFQFYLNKLTLTSEPIIRNKFLFILTRFHETAINLIFSNLLKINIKSKVEFNSKIKLFIELTLSTPNEIDNELSRYFLINNIDFNANKSTYINYIIEKCDVYIENELTNNNLSNDDSINEQKSKLYNLMFSCFGIMYSYSKKNIYNKIREYKTCQWYSMAILFFILHSDINLMQLKSFEKNFISNLLKSHYINQTNKLIKIMFENVFSIKLNIKSIDNKSMDEFIINK